MVAIGVETPFCAAVDSAIGCLVMYGNGEESRETEAGVDCRADG